MILCTHDPVWATYWRTISTSDKYTDINISTSEKDMDGNYINSSWLVRCIGHAHNKIKNIKDGTHIRLMKYKLSNESYVTAEGERKRFFRFLLMDFDVNEDGNSSRGGAQQRQQSQNRPARNTSKPAHETPKPAAVEEDEDDDWTPFG